MMNGHLNKLNKYNSKESIEKLEFDIKEQKKHV